jgi:hypothetical protein
MALALNIDTLDSVPEAVRALYVPNGDKFKLDVDGIEDTAGLKSALEKERTTARELSKQTGAWKALGKTPEEIQALISAQEKAETEKLAQAGEWDKLRAQQNDLHAKAIAAMTETVAAKDRAVSKNVVDAQAIAAIAASKGNTDLLMPFVRSALKAVEVDGDYSVRVIGTDGNPRVNAKGDFLSVSDLVSEMKQDTKYGPLFQSSGASGGGMSQSGTGSNLTTISSSDKAAIGANLEAIAKGTIKVT